MLLILSDSEEKTCTKPLTANMDSSESSVIPADNSNSLKLNMSCGDMDAAISNGKTLEPMDVDDVSTVSEMGGSDSITAKNDCSQNPNNSKLHDPLPDDSNMDVDLPTADIKQNNEPLQDTKASTETEVSSNTEINQHENTSGTELSNNIDKEASVDDSAEDIAINNDSGDITLNLSPFSESEEALLLGSPTKSSDKHENTTSENIQASNDDVSNDKPLPLNEDLVQHLTKVAHKENGSELVDELKEKATVDDDDMCDVSPSNSQEKTVGEPSEEPKPTMIDSNDKVESVNEITNGENIASEVPESNNVASKVLCDISVDSGSMDASNTNKDETVKKSKTDIEKSSSAQNEVIENSISLDTTDVVPDKETLEECRAFPSDDSKKVEDDDVMGNSEMEDVEGKSELNLVPSNTNGTEDKIRSDAENNIEKGDEKEITDSGADTFSEGKQPDKPSTRDNIDSSTDVETNTSSPKEDKTQGEMDTENSSFGDDGDRDLKDSFRKAEKEEAQEHSTNIVPKEESETGSLSVTGGDIKSKSTLNEKVESNNDQEIEAKEESVESLPANIDATDMKETDKTGSQEKRQTESPTSTESDDDDCKLNSMPVTGDDMDLQETYKIIDNIKKDIQEKIENVNVSDNEKDMECQTEGDLVPKDGEKKNNKDNGQIQEKPSTDLAEKSSSHNTDKANDGKISEPMVVSDDDDSAASVTNKVVNTDGPTASGATDSSQETSKQNDKEKVSIVDSISSRKDDKAVKENECVALDDDDDDIVLIDDSSSKASDSGKTAVSVPETTLDVPSDKKESESKMDVDKDTITKSIEDTPKSKPDYPISPLTIMKKLKPALDSMSREDLEEFLVVKIVESISGRSALSDIQIKLKSQEKSMEEWRKKVMTLSKQNKDLTIVLRNLCDEQQKRQKENPLPIKITRSVGLQVGYPSIKVSPPTSSVTLPSTPPTTPAASVPTMSKPPNKHPAPPPPGKVAIAASPNILTRRTRMRQDPSAPQTSPVPTQSVPVPLLTPIKSNTLNSPASSQTISPATSQMHSLQIRPKRSPVVAPKLIPIPATNNTNKNVTNRTLLRPMPEPNQKSAEKRPSLHSIDLTDDEPPTKIQAIRTPPRPMPTIRPVNTNQLTSPSKVTYVINGSNVATNVGTTARPVFIPITAPGQNVQQNPNVMIRGKMMNKVHTVSHIRQLTPGVRIGPPIPIRPHLHPAPLPQSINSKAQLNPSWKWIPPRPTLKIAKVDNGIVISWEMDDFSDSQHEAIASYQIYAYQEASTQPTTDLWKKIGDVKALPLPMACTLTHFMAGFKYYFAVRAIDIRTRVGPFSAPGQITLVNSKK